LQEDWARWREEPNYDSCGQPILHAALCSFSENNRDSHKGYFDHAIADYTEAIRLDPKNAVAYNNRGLAYRAKGDNDHANRQPY
jgi:Flp pilus assembly protein TadD